VLLRGRGEAGVMAAGPDATGAGAGTLFLVPTPIGNVRDITTRAVDVLRSASVIAAEDTRKAGTLLRTLGIRARLLSYYDFNEQARSEQLIGLLLAGQDVALISDAGTPLLNDPGFRVVTAAIAAGLSVCPLPGPSAILTALVGSGLPCHRFEYVGFLPRRPAARKAAIGRLASQQATLVLFEAPHRLPETVADLRAVLGDRDAALARNLSKSDECYLRGPLSAVEAELAALDQVRGEYTIVVAGASGPDLAAADQLGDRLIGALLRHGAASRLIRDVVRDVTGLPRNRVYERLEELRQAPGC
jgi:16S rRNA (cytidine1402-2'-O)-methyltransferase